MKVECQTNVFKRIPEVLGLVISNTMLGNDTTFVPYKAGLGKPGQCEMNRKYGLPLRSLLGRQDPASV